MNCVKTYPKYHILLIFLWITSSVLFSQSTHAKENKKLDKIHESIVERYPTVEHISSNELVSLQGETVLFFDIRKESEFSVSHLESATRIAPETGAAEFLAEYGDRIHGKTVVFYCSVGERSSRLAETINQYQAASKEATTYRIVNLEGGIFKWHNNHLPLFKEGIQTDSVHPYNIFWGRLLERKEHIKRK